MSDGDGLHPALRHAIRRAGDAVVKASALPSPGAPKTGLVWSTVVSVQTDGSGNVTLTVHVEGSTTSTPGVTFLGSYPPNVGDRVLGEWLGTYFVVFGATSPYGQQYLVPTPATTNYQAQNGDLVECSGGSFTVTAPAHPKKGNRFGVIKTDAYSVGQISVTVTARGRTSWLLAAKGAGYVYEWDGSAWLVVETIESEWDSYTPTWTSNTGTPPAIGNGSVVGRFCQVGTTIRFGASVFMGSTTTFGTNGAWFLGIPTSVSSASIQYPACTGWTYNNSGYGLLTGQWFSTTSFLLLGLQNGTAINQVGNGGSFVGSGQWANGDYVETTGTYEMA